MGNSKINPKIYSALGQGGSMFGITLPDVARKKDNVIVLSADMSTPAGKGGETMRVKVRSV